jgi:hypothetical protein
MAIRQLGFGFVFLCAVAPSLARADVVIAFDENGGNRVNGVLSAMTSANLIDPLDPFSPLRPLIYTLPAGVVGTPVAGDVLLTEGGVVTDLVRFTDRLIIFYSDPGDRDDNPLGDVGITTTRQTNVVSIPEVGLPAPAINGAVYTPTANQPGFLGPGTVYTIVSDGVVVPEPGTLVLSGVLALGGIAALTRKRLLAA